MRDLSGFFHFPHQFYIKSFQAVGEQFGGHLDSLFLPTDLQLVPVNIRFYYEVRKEAEVKTSETLFDKVTNGKLNLLPG